MSDGVLDDIDQIRILVNLVGVHVGAVKSYVGRSSREEAVVHSLGNPVCLILACPSMEQAQLQAEIFWEQKIPARICVGLQAAREFLATLTLGKEDPSE